MQCDMSALWLCPRLPDVQTAANKHLQSILQRLIPAEACPTGQSFDSLFREDQPHSEYLSRSIPTGKLSGHKAFGAVPAEGCPLTGDKGDLKSCRRSLRAGTNVKNSAAVAHHSSSPACAGSSQLSMRGKDCRVCVLAAHPSESHIREHLSYLPSQAGAGCPSCP